MKRYLSTIDFPGIVAAKIIADTKQGLRHKSSVYIPFKHFTAPAVDKVITITETTLGNLSFVCPICHRQNILSKQKMVVAMCKFCRPTKSPD